MSDSYDLAKHFKKVKVIGPSEGPQGFLKALARELDKVRKDNGTP